MEKIVESAWPLSHEQMMWLNVDGAKAAECAQLMYVNDRMPGIIRRKKGKGFIYLKGGKRVTHQNVLQRIKSLVIPPAWTKVWICVLPHGHIQATGYDLLGRKQYKYHPNWNALRNETKFHRLYEFGKSLPLLREKIERDLKFRTLNKELVLATIISLMERTYIRIGNEDYEKLYGSYGLTTLKDKHVQINAGELKFSFTGKKGIAHSISLRNKKLARIVKQCRDIPGKELFQYYDEKNKRHTIDSGMVNQYIKDAMGGNFSAKDFRTWAGTLNLLRSLQSLGEALTAKETKKNILVALDEVSQKLGNTRTVCRKYYVHPALIRLYEENNLFKYLTELDVVEDNPQANMLTTKENQLMSILKNLP